MAYGQADGDDNVEGCRASVVIGGRPRRDGSVPVGAGGPVRGPVVNAGDAAGGSLRRRVCASTLPCRRQGPYIFFLYFKLTEKLYKQPLSLRYSLKSSFGPPVFVVMAFTNEKLNLF